MSQSSSEGGSSNSNTTSGRKHHHHQHQHQQQQQQQQQHHHHHLHPDVSSSAYAMSASVERSAECVLAVLSTNTPMMPSYGRSISSPCGDPRVTSNYHHSPTNEPDENESAASMRRSYPGALSETKSTVAMTNSEAEGNNSESPQNGPEDVWSGCDDGTGSVGGGDTEIDPEPESVASEEPSSQAESIPDSFHTPSASIQNLNSSVNSGSNNNNNTNNNNFNNNGRLRASTRSNASGSSTDSVKAAASGHTRSGSGGGTKSDSEVKKEQSPKQGAKKDKSESVKGSPEGARKDVGGGNNSSGNSSINLETTPPQTSVVLEVHQSVESKDSVSSSGGSSVSSRDQVILGTPARFIPKPNKKKMWYHVFYPSYKTRSSDFKRIFKDLPAEERLIVDYSCALQREILIQGRMYVSQNFISFYANIFGWETQTSIRLKDVTSITKEKTALIIPNAVQVSTDNERFFFTSFVTRDSTYMMLFKLWQSCLLEEVEHPLPTKEIWKLVHSCYGDELGVASEEDPEEFLACATETGSGGTVVNAPSVTTLISSDGDDGKSLTDIEAQVCAGELGAELVVSPEALVGSDSPVGLLTVPEIGLGISSPTTDASDSTDSEADVEPHAKNAGPVSVVRPKSSQAAGPVLSVAAALPAPVLAELACPVPHTDGREVVNTIIPTDVDTLFTMLFTNSKFFLDLHTARKTFDIVQSAWQQSPDGSQKTRQVSFTVTLNHVMGPKHSQVTESQVMLPVSKPGRLYVIEVESVNAGIPYADSFYVTAHFCLTRISSKETRLCIVNQIKYKKSVWKYTKGFIEKNTWAGLEEFYSNLERALKEECSKANVPLVAPVIAGPRRRNGRKKYPAPGIPCDAVAATPAHSVIRGLPSAGIPLAVGNSATVSAGSQTTAESSLVLKIILGVLACLFFLNAFLYVKLTRFETSKSHLLFPSRPIAVPQHVPRNHDEWMALLQEQEDLHRLELQKWHEILLSALQVLQQAEEDLEALKFHVTSYSKEKFTVGSFKTALDSLQSGSSETSGYLDDQGNQDGTNEDENNYPADHRQKDGGNNWNSEQESSREVEQDINNREL